MRTGASLFVAVVMASLLTASTVTAAPAPLAQDQDPAQLLVDFIHYSLVAKPDLAGANARALMDSGLANADLARLLDDGTVDEARYDRAMQWAIRVPELEPVVAELGLRIQSGILDLMRDPDRIAEAIEWLDGHQRQRLMAQQRLEAAGEYAVPQLLQVITEGSNDRLRLRSAEVLRKIGRLAVTPLCAALPNLGDPNGQRLVAFILGDIGWRNAAPTLKQIAVDGSAPEALREAASRAFEQVGGSEGTLSQLYAELGRDYFDGQESLIAYPEEATNNVWSYDQFIGLVKEPIPTEIFGEVMAMKMASEAVKLDASNSNALSLFVAANLKRANELPADKNDPIFGEGRYSPEFYATVFGTQTCMDVLALALDSTDTPLVRDAIASLAQTTGGANLFGRGGRQPLLKALDYPDRRVQYEAALTLGEALPNETFAGAFRVVPLLASAVRSGARTYALVIADEDEDRLQAVGDLERMGFEVVGFDSTVGGARAQIAEAVGVDLIVVWKRNPEEVERVITNLSALAKTSVAPILVLAQGVDAPGLVRTYRDNRRVKVERPGIGSEGLAAAVEEVMQRASGGRMTESEAEIYAIEALSVLRDISLSGSPAYDIGDAETALLEALDTRTGGTRMLVAVILALIDSDRAQRRLFDAALTATDDEQIELLGFAAESVKRFGNRSEQRHVNALFDVVANSSGATADAAARVHGALNRPTSGAASLIP